MSMDIDSWLDSISAPGWIWYAKRLSANDSGATGSHMAGIYLPKQFLWLVFPSMKTGSNPDVWFDARVWPCEETRKLRGIWYNGRTRNESRITNWNTPSRVLYPDLTGAICLFAFELTEQGKNAEYSEIWLCQNAEEEARIEERLGEILPGEGQAYAPDGPFQDIAGGLFATPTKGCSLAENEIPAEWLTNFPSGQTLVNHALALRSARSESPDRRLLKRRECETELFYSIERACVLPRIREGFASVDQFVNFANSVTNRRKSRAGKSLELHLKEIFTEERLTFAHGEKSEGDKRPDFLFPSAQAYRDRSWPQEKLRMLAAKTTCKDRWRQILNETDRIANKHLLTLQEGVSENQFREMSAEGVTLVVPQFLHARYPAAIREQLITLDAFIAETRAVCI